MSREAMQLALEALEDANDVARMEFGDEDYHSEAINALRQALVDADDTSQKRVDKMVKTEHDRAVELGQASERGWNAALAQQEPVGDDRVMTVVYRNVQKEDAQSFTDHPKAVWFGWCHAPYQRDDAIFKLEKVITSPPASKPWVGLTDQEVMVAAYQAGFDIHEDYENEDDPEAMHWWTPDGEACDDSLLKLRDLIEAKLKEKNT